MPKRPIDTGAWSKNWKQGMDAAGPAYQRGIANCDVDPMERAANALEKAKTNYIQAIDSGKTARRLRETSKATWQQLASSKGASRLSTGANEALPKVNAKIARMAPLMDQLRATIDSMPNNTPSEREQRMLAWTRGMAAIKNQI